MKNLSWTSYRNQSRVLNAFFALSYVAMLAICARYAFYKNLPAVRETISVAMVWATYSFIYLLPALVAARLVFHAAKWADSKVEGSRWTVPVVYGFAAVAVGLSETVIIADGVIFGGYGFHLNGFVFNLLTTPGGIESLGQSRSAEIGVFASVAGIFALNAILIFGVHCLICRKYANAPAFRFPVYRYLLLLFFVGTLSERALYGVSDFQAYAPVLAAAEAFPFYLPTTLKSLGRNLGFHPSRHGVEQMKVSGGPLVYPRKDLVVEKKAKPRNIVWLTAESWRWDMLTPEIMPETWKFARKSIFFKNHYSGGIGTRMGIFTMFYGLYGPYWFPFLNQGKSPVFMDVVRKKNYQAEMFTSARFSYPEFDKTVFSEIERQNLHEYASGQGWMSDRKNVGDLLEFIEHRNPDKPFVTFMFFESPHARYFFPEESAIRKPYLKDFNYAAMPGEKDMPLVFNRYVNACRHLDSQFARVIDFLEKEKILDDTIVVITGDHGEEFMEKGRWGHNSEFHEEQLRVPLVLHIPGETPRSIDYMTSHVDLPATLLPLMGVKNPPGDYGLGIDLLGNDRHEYLVATDWSRICLIPETLKMTFPYKTSGFFQNEVTARDDGPLPENTENMAPAVSNMHQIMEELGRFKAKPAG